MRGARVKAPAIAGAYLVTVDVADTYGSRRRWADWLRLNVAGPCLVLEHEGTLIRQELFFADGDEALLFFMRWGSGGTIELVTREPVWTDITSGGRHYSPCVFAQGWPVE